MDHDRVNISSTGISCGIMGLSRIGDETDAVLYAIAVRLYHPSRGDPCAAIIFSNIAAKTIPRTADDRLAAAIKVYKIGTVYESEKMENPKTGNVIKMYTWIVDHEAFKKMYIDWRLKRMAKAGS